MTGVLLTPVHSLVFPPLTSQHTAVVQMFPVGRIPILQLHSIAHRQNRRVCSHNQCSYKRKSQNIADVLTDC